MIWIRCLRPRDSKKSQIPHTLATAREGWGAPAERQESTEGVGPDGSVSKSGHFRPASDDSPRLRRVDLVVNTALLPDLLRNFGCYPPAWGEVSTYEENGEDASASIGSDFRG